MNITVAKIIEWPHSWQASRLAHMLFGYTLINTMTDGQDRGQTLATRERAKAACVVERGNLAVSFTINIQHYIIISPQVVV